MAFPYDGCFFIKSGIKGRIVRIDVQKILYIEAALNYVIIHSEHDRQITYLTMKEIEDILDPVHFIRVHKSFIVGFRMIYAIEGCMVILNNKIVIPLGASFRTQFMIRLNSVMIVTKRS